MSQSPARLHVYFKLGQSEAEAWRERWRNAARRTCEALPGLQIALSERTQGPMTWMESYSGLSPAQLDEGEAAMQAAMQGLSSVRHREMFEETFRAP